MPSGPRIFVPPPLVFIVAYAAGVGIHRLYPVATTTAADGVVAVLAPVVFLAGVGLTLAGLLTLLRARTGIMPLRPVRFLVTIGPYRFTRNPIYLGLTIAYLGVAAMYDHVWPLVTLPLGLWVLRKTAIDVEEAHLAGRFGEEYEEYCRRVRRWI
ncbi:MAG TPA: isoprenylcysteine carboxylmethyltransferase family protein [Gemmatimonadales bacterium]